MPKNTHNTLQLSAIRGNWLNSGLNATLSDGIFIWVTVQTHKYIVTEQLLIISQVPLYRGHGTRT